MQSGTTSTDLGHPAHEPFFWLKQAAELDRVAMLIWTAMRSDLERMSQSPVGAVLELQEIPYANLGGVFWLNAGLALENLFKGIIIQGNPNCVVNGFVTKALKTHNLLKLAKQASFDLDVMDAFFLSVGTECVMWAGRYPCSTKADETAPPVFSEGDVIAYKRLFDRLACRFDAHLSRSVTFKRVT